MNNFLEFRRRQTQQQAHYDLSAKHRVDETHDFNRFIWKWLVGLVVIVFLIGVGAAMACGDLDTETIKIRVDGI